ncbi:MAG: hypothetical protein E7310_04615 [Clostridiales bacterium]|nr:hypothetical protein [Clostridiales bacterium]
MKNLLKFLLFIIYTLVIFLTSKWEILLLELIINILVMLIVRVSVKGALKNLLNVSVFIVITAIANIFIVHFEYAFLIGARLVLVCNITYSFSKVLSYFEFAKVIEKLFTPLKLFKVNPEDISLIICIAIAFLPILKDEFIQLKRVIKVKGYTLKISNCGIILKPFFISLFERINEVSYSLKAKAYAE